MDGQTCETCRFWVPLAPQTMGAEMEGECHRRAPAPDERDHSPMWTVTECGDWCGEHQRAKGAQQ